MKKIKDYSVSQCIRDLTSKGVVFENITLGQGNIFYKIKIKPGSLGIRSIGKLDFLKRKIRYITYLGILLLIPFTGCTKAQEVPDTLKFKANTLYIFRQDLTLYKTQNNIDFKDSLKKIFYGYFSKNDSSYTLPVLTFKSAGENKLTFYVKNWPPDSVAFYDSALISQVRAFIPYWRKNKSLQTFGSYIDSIITH